jgi:hypothetical protein
MSNATEVHAKAALSDEDNRRKRAEAIVKKAIRGTLAPLQDKAVDHRLLPGLWTATVNILIACLDVKDMLRLLNSRAATLRDEGENSGEPPVVLAGQALAKYMRDITAAAQVIAAAVDECIPQLEAEGLGDRLPEAMLDAAIFLLVNSWGPAHLKRAIVEQVATMLLGNAAAAVFMEPSRLLRKSDPEQHPDIAQHADAADPEIAHPPIPDRNEKTIRAFADYRLDGDAADWAVVILKTVPGGGSELHALKGRTADANGRTAPLLAFVEAMRAISHENARSAVTLETCHGFVLKGFDNSDGTAAAHRHASEAALWNEYDRLAADRPMRFRAAAPNLSDPAQHACDVVLARGVETLF